MIRMRPLATHSPSFRARTALPYRLIAALLLGLTVLAAEPADKVASLPNAIPGAAQFLQKYPASDLNADGILTAAEKEQFCEEETIRQLGGGYTYRREMVAMRDGVKLATAVFVPPGDGPFPAVIIRTAYGIWAAALFEPATFANQGVAFITQDLRGDGESEGAGTFDPTSFDNEINDGYDTIDWIAKQTWCNGRVGITGQSGHGFAAYMAYLARHPNLVTANTNISGGNAWLYWTFHNGVTREMYNGWIPQRNVVIPQWPRPTIKLFDHQAYGRVVTSAAQDNATAFIARTGWYDIFAESALDYFRDFAADGNVFIRVDAAGHGNMSGRSFPPRPVPPEWVLPNQVALLKDPAAARPASSRMLYYQMGDPTDPTAPGNCYKVTDVWPVPHTPVSYFMKADGSLDTTTPDNATNALSFTYDPRNPVPSVGGDVFIHQGVGPRDQRELKERTDILRFSSAPLTQPLEITGKVLADLYVSSDVTDTTFTAKLVDVYPDGYEAVVRDSIIMGRFHKGFDQQHPLKKGEVYKLRLDMWSTSLVVNKGHRLAVHISSSNSPKYDVHPNTFAQVASFKDVPIATNKIHLSAAHASCIILPIVTPAPAP